MSFQDLVITEFRNVGLDTTEKGFDRLGTAADKAEHRVLDLTESIKRPGREAKVSGCWKRPSRISAKRLRKPTAKRAS